MFIMRSFSIGDWRLEEGMSLMSISIVRLIRGMAGEVGRSDKGTSMRAARTPAGLEGSLIYEREHTARRRKSRLSTITKAFELVFASAPDCE